MTWSKFFTICAELLFTIIMLLICAWAGSKDVLLGVLLAWICGMIYMKHLESCKDEEDD